MMPRLMQPTDCLNCETPLSDGQRFCPNCGQKADTHRLTWKHFSHEFFHALVADKGLVHLFKELVLRPGVVVREYLAGKRQKYFNPFSYFLISAGVIVLAGSVFGSETPETAPDPVILARLKTEAARANYVALLHRSYVVTRFISKHGNLIAIAALPVLASVWWLFYRRRGYNYVEFLTGTMLIDSVSNVVVPLLMALAQRAGSVAVVQNATRVALVLHICYLTYGLTGFLQLKSWKARLGGATVVLLSQMAWMAVAYSLLGAYLFRNRQFYQFPLRVVRALVTF